VSKLGLLKSPLTTEPFAVANGCEHSSFIYFAMIIFCGKKKAFSDVIERKDPLATANGSVLCDHVASDLFIALPLVPFPEF